MRNVPEEAYVFVGSSTARREVVEILVKLIKDLKREHLHAIGWHDEFRAGPTTIERLELLLSRRDYAIFVFGDDDLQASGWVPRDNVVFEAGLFIGRLGRHRTFIVTPRVSKVKIPTDLDGVTTGSYDPQDLEGSLRRFVDQIQSALQVPPATDDGSLVDAFIEIAGKSASMNLWEVFDNPAKLVIGARELMSRPGLHRAWVLLHKLADYYEWSGKYVDGIKLFDAVSRFKSKWADRADGSTEQRERMIRRWLEIRFAGWLQILNRKYGRAQVALTACLAEIDPQSDDDYSQIFYCNRYLSVSCLRADAVGPSPSTVLSDAARRYMLRAEEAIERSGTEERQQQLRARIGMNWGNLALVDSQFQEARGRYEKSLEIFESSPREHEHVGICHLKLAEATISDSTAQPPALRESEVHLDKAEEVFQTMGWIEGHARMLEWRAKLYRRQQVDVAVVKLVAAQAVRLFERMDNDGGRAAAERVKEWLTKSPS